MRLFDVVSKIKHATRYLIPVELLVYAMLFVLALGGAFGSGLLHETLLDRDESVTWFLVIGSISLTAFGVSLSEWLWGSDWEDRQLRRWLILRKWAALLGMVICSYALFTMIQTPRGLHVFVVAWGAAVMGVFLGWSWWVNFRAETVLDPKLPTSHLEDTLASRRTRW